MRKRVDVLIRSIDAIQLKYNKYQGLLAGKLYFIFKKNICQFIIFEVDLSNFLNLSFYIYQVRNSIGNLT